MCRWFAMCDREAVGTVRHPILGDVPVCERCGALADAPVEPHPPTWPHYIDQDDDDPDDHEFGCTCIFCTPGA